MEYLRPVFGGLNVHFDHPGVGRHAQFFDPVVPRRLVPFNDHGDFQSLCGRLNGGQQFQVMLNQLTGGHKNVDLATPLLHTNGGFERIHQLGRSESVFFSFLFLLFDEILRIFEFGFFFVDRLFSVYFRIRNPLRHPFIGRAIVSISNFVVIFSQCAHFFKGAALNGFLFLFRNQYWQAIQRHAQAHWRVSGQQKHVLAAEFPHTAPPGFGIAVPTYWQGISYGFIQTPL